MTTVSESSQTSAISHAVLPESAQLIPRFRWTQRRFQQLIEQGFFGDDERLELMEGEIVPMEPPGPFHSSRINPLDHLLYERYDKNLFTTRTEQPIVLGEQDQPQPDIVVCSGAWLEFSERYPVASEVRLVVEVAKSSLSIDRDKRLKRYARAGVPEYWILNVPERQLEVYREPRQNGYATIRIYQPDESVAPLDVSAENPIPLRDLLA